jgi:Lon protease-like protein
MADIDDNADQGGTGDAHEARPCNGSALGRFPLFALPNAWLFPGAVMPLFVFEPRYVQMVEDLLDRCGRLVIGTVVEGGDPSLHGAPPVMSVGGLGEIGRHERRPDGRFVIIVVGLARVVVDEVRSDRLYRQVEARAVVENCTAEIGTGSAPELRKRLVCAINQLAPEAKGISADVPLGRLADFVLLRLSPGPHLLRQLHAELDEQQRAARVLELYDAR